jgi:hypothetical protein
MSRGKSIVHREDMITVSSSSNNVGDHESLGVNQEQTSKAQTSTHDVRSLSAMSYWGVPS